jgi:catechol 2,3-dioxygenase-like lactoylglutathione lyase family enzyme
MPIRKLDHYNLLTTKLDETVAFYTDVLGMKGGVSPRGDRKTGAWIYDGTDTPVVHLQAVDPAAPEKKLAEVRGRLGEMAERITVDNLIGSGVMEHVAFECDGYDEFMQRFEQAGIDVRKNDIPEMNFRQLFVRDPNGVILELNFR